ncbi:hypothetical protein [Haladaptatus salinisoli]|uniref:hypothetical protein n=1 Tax=Haladaptatus salinisoli TaxID=2884876 RepID=UPI001D0A06EE|nr:hypothetical protein [Haladaptatus salinisoli]
MSDEEANSQSAESNPVLRRLNRLVGEWETEVRIDGQTFRGGRETFNWIEDGAFLVHHSETVDLSDAPTEWIENAPRSAVSVIGLDDSNEEFTMLYSDSRDVFRVYHMSLSDGVWKIWRDTPGFAQRFTGTFSEDGDTIEGTSERSDDGAEWDVDFDVTYRRVGE